MEIVQITNDRREVTEPELLERAEPVHRQLRPQMQPDYAAQMRGIFAGGGEMCVIVEGTEVLGVAVFRCYENTFSGRKFYVDDLVTDENFRSSGLGRALIVYLEGVARSRGCTTVELDSGTQRTRAHRFYFREGFFVSSFSFRKEFK